MTSWSQRLKVNRTRPLRRRTWTNVHKHPQVQKEDKAIFLMCQSCSAWALRVSCGQVTDWEETKESSVTNYVLDKWSGALNVTKDTAQVHSPMFSLTCGLDDRVCMHQRGGGSAIVQMRAQMNLSRLGLLQQVPDSYDIILWRGERQEAQSSLTALAACSQQPQACVQSNSITWASLVQLSYDERSEEFFIGTAVMAVGQRGYLTICNSTVMREVKKCLDDWSFLCCPDRHFLYNRT